MSVSTSVVPMPLFSEILRRIPHLRHGFFTRRGGVSEGCFASLNAGFSSGDCLDNVRENRRRIADFFEVSPSLLLTPCQIHSSQALFVDQEMISHLSHGNNTAATPSFSADALVTVLPDIAIGVLTADCGSVLLADPTACVIGAAHAGWRGALSGILENTVSLMEEKGALRSSIVAAIGPMISRRAYTVGSDFQSTFIERDPHSHSFFFWDDSGETLQFDLPGYLEGRLKRMGLHVISPSPACTFSNPEDFFSYRYACQKKQSNYGRLLSVLRLER